MAIRIQQYNTGPRRIGVGGIDPGYQQPRIGNIAATAENQLAGTVLEAGKALTNVAIKEYVSTETTRVSQSLLAMQKELSAERDRYMAENQGQNAIEAGQHFEKFARETAQKYFQEGGFSGRFAEMFNKQAAGTALHFTEQGQAYGRQQEALWKDSNYKSSVQEKLNAISQDYNNPEFIEFQLHSFDELVDGMFPGMDNRARKLEFRQNAAGSIIEGYLSHDDIRGARGAFGQYKELLGDKANAVELQIRNRADALEAKARADAERARAAQERAQNQAAAQLGLSILNESIENPEKAKERLSGIEDPVFRQKVMTSYMTGASLNARMDDMIKEYKKTTSYNDGVSKLDAIMKDASLSIEQKNAGIVDLLMNTSDPNVRKQLDEEAKYRINGFEAPVNDRIWADAQSYAAQPGVTPDMVTARFMGALPPSYLEKARKSSQDQQWKQEEQLLKDDLISTLKNEFNYKDADAQVYYRLILSQLNGTVGYESRRKKAQSLAVKIAVDKGRWFTGQDIPAAGLPRYREMGYQFSKVVEIPETVKPMIDEALSAQGKELTDENRKALYQKYLRQQGE